MRFSLRKLKYSSQDNYAKNCGFFCGENLNCRAFSPDGFIEDQSALSALPYAARDSAYCGCGWIAFWNICKACKKEIYAPDLIAEAEKATVLRGVFGTGPFALRRIIRRHGFSVKLFYSAEKFIAKNPKMGIVLYLRKDFSAHYAAFTALGENPDGKPLYRFYNAKLFGKPLTLAEFFAKKSPLGVICFNIT